MTGGSEDYFTHKYFCLFFTVGLRTLPIGQKINNNLFFLLIQKIHPVGIAHHLFHGLGPLRMILIRPVNSFNTVTDSAFFLNQRFSSIFLILGKGRDPQYQRQKEYSATGTVKEHFLFFHGILSSFCVFVMPRSFFLLRPRGTPVG
jgi:hypothetical protein